MVKLRKYLLMVGMLLPLFVGSLYIIPSEEAEAAPVQGTNKSKWYSSSGDTQRQTLSFDLPPDFRAFGGLTIDSGRIESYNIDYLNRKLNVVVDGTNNTTPVYRYTNPSSIISDSWTCSGMWCQGDEYYEFRKSTLNGAVVEYAEKKVQFRGGVWGYDLRPWDEIPWHQAFNTTDPYSDWYAFHISTIPSGSGESVVYQFRYYTGKEVASLKYNYSLNFHYVSDLHKWGKYNVAKGTQKGIVQHISNRDGTYYGSYRKVSNSYVIDPVTGIPSLPEPTTWSYGTEPSKTEYFVEGNKLKSRYYDGYYTWWYDHVIGDLQVDVRGTKIGTVTHGNRYEYPDNGKSHKDNYWYVYEGQDGILLSDMNSGNRTVNKKKGQNTFTLTGNVMNFTGSDVTISAQLGGVVKTTTISNPSSKKPWSLTWSEKELPAGNHGINIYAKDSGYDFGYTYSGVINVDKRDLYVWEKWTIKQVQGYKEVGMNIISQDPAVKPAAYQYLDVNATTGAASVRGERVDFSYAPCFTTSNLWCSGSRGGYYVENGKPYYLELWGTVENGFFRQGWALYTVNIARSPNAPWVSGKDQLVDANVIEFQGTYPDDGPHSDGYWYVLKGKYVEEPELSLDVQPKIYVSEVAGRRTFSISGNVLDAGSNPITVGATLGSKEKYVVVTGTSSGNPKSFSLTWDVVADAIPEGTYTNIKVTASNGIGAREATSGLIVVVDKTKPSASNVYLRSNNVDPKYAKAGDQITLQLTSSEQLIKAPSTKIHGVNASLSGQNGNSYSFNKTMSQTELAGVLSFEAELEDLAGNKTKVTQTTDGQLVEFYPLPPVLQTVSINSSGVDPRYAKVGDTVTVEGQMNQKVKNLPTVRVANKLVPVQKVGEYGFKGQLVMSEQDTEGRVSFVVDNLVDSAGNIGRVTSDNTDGKPVTFDKTPPTFSLVSIQREGQVVRLDMVSNEKLKSVPQVTIAGNPVSAVSGGISTSFIAEYTLTGNEDLGEIPFTINNFVDLANNPGSIVTTTTDGSKVVVDLKGESLSYVRIFSNGPDSSVASEGNLVTVEFESARPLSSDIGLEIAGTPVSVENVSGNKWKGSKTMWSGDKTGEIEFKLTDLKYTEGTELSNIYKTTDGSKVVFNKVNPSLDSVVIWSGNNNPEYAKVGDEIVVEIVSNKPLADPPLVTIAGEVAQPDESGNKFGITVTESTTEGEVIFGIGNVSDIGNNLGDFVDSTTDGSKVIVDTTPPKIENVLIGGGKREGDTITLTFDSDEALKHEPSVSIGGTTVSVTKVGNNKYKAEKTVTSDMTGKLVFYISDIEDLAGNLGSPVSDVSNGDNPSVESGGAIMINLYGVEDGGSYSKVATPTFSASSSLSQDVKVSATLDGSEWKSGRPIKSSGDHTLRITAEDQQGNREVLSVTFRITN